MFQIYPSVIRPLIAFTLIDELSFIVTVIRIKFFDISYRTAY